MGAGAACSPAVALVLVSPHRLTEAVCGRGGTLELVKGADEVEAWLESLEQLVAGSRLHGRAVPRLVVPMALTGLR